MKRINEKGAATAELAASIPLLIIISTLLVQASVVMLDQLSVMQASRVGARAAAVSPSNEAITTAALQATGLNPARTKIAIGERGGRGQLVNVTVSYQSQIVLPFTHVELMRPVVSSRSAMAVEN